MPRTAISEVIKIRKQIIALSDDDFADLLRDIDIIQEIREDIAAKPENGKSAPLISTATLEALRGAK